MSFPSKHLINSIFLPPICNAGTLFWARACCRMLPSDDGGEVIAPSDAMPRYYFHIYDGVDLPDPEGTELASPYEARLEAIRLAGEIFRVEAQKIALGQDWHLEVADGAGLVLFRLDFNVMDSAAAKSF